MQSFFFYTGAGTEKNTCSMLLLFGKLRLVGLIGNIRSILCGIIFEFGKSITGANNNSVFETEIGVAGRVHTYYMRLFARREVSGADIKTAVWWLFVLLEMVSKWIDKSFAFSSLLFEGGLIISGEARNQDCCQMIGAKIRLPNKHFPVCVPSHISQFQKAKIVL
jgi:hypothetical protein